MKGRSYSLMSTSDDPFLKTFHDTFIYSQGPPNTFFFFENSLKKTTEYFLKFLFYLMIFFLAKKRPTSQICSSVYTTIFVRRKDKTNYLSNQIRAKCYHSRNKHQLKKKRQMADPIHERQILQFNVYFERSIFEKLFMALLFTPKDFARRLAVADVQTEF